MAPNFAMVSISKLPVNSAQFRGQPYLIYFWFTNCPPCVQTTPMLVKLFQKYSPQGFQIVAANGDRVLGLTVHRSGSSGLYPQAEDPLPRWPCDTCYAANLCGVTFFPTYVLREPTRSHREAPGRPAI